MRKRLDLVLLAHTWGCTGATRPEPGPGCGACEALLRGMPRAQEAIACRQRALVAWSPAGYCLSPAGYCLTPAGYA